MSESVVLVTGATGYIASVLIDLLVAKGYTVRGTVRDLDAAHAKELQAAYPGIKLYQADLLDRDTLQAPISGCDFVCHTASPFKLRVTDPQTELIEPAVTGTRNVMETCVQEKIKRVVVTSSVAAVGPPQTQTEIAKLPADYMLTESDWVLDASLDNGPYRMSKTLAEKTAWEVADKAGMELATINPSFVLGPPVISRVAGESLELMHRWLSGKEETAGNSACGGQVDVRDIAAAHEAALRVPEAKGNRFILSDTVGRTQHEVAQILIGTGDFKAYPIPTQGAGTLAYRPKFDNSKAARVLGVQAGNIERALRDMASRMINTGMVEARE